MGFSHLGVGGLLIPHLGGQQTYSQKVKSIFGSSLLAYWMLDELAGATADNAEGTAARDGTYTGVTLGQTGIGDGRTSPLFDGANDYVNVDGIRAAISGNTGTIALWAKVANAAVWSDGATRRMFIFYKSSTFADTFGIRRNSAVNGGLVFDFILGGINDGATYVTASPTGWFHVAMTWDKAADQFKAYYNGLQVDTTKTTLGVYAASLDRAFIGALNTTPQQVWNGYLAHLAVGNTALSQPSILELATV